MDGVTNRFDKPDAFAGKRGNMWEQYKSTLFGMQILISLVTLAIYFRLGHIWQMAALFFVTMQIGNLIGAAWAARLKNRRPRSALGIE